MNPLVLVYNLILLVLDLGVLAVWRRQRTGRLWLTGLALAGAAMLALGVLAMAFQPEDPYFGPRFMLYGCLAWGIFLHGPFLLLASAVLFRREHRRASAAAGVLALAIVAFAVDAFWIEPRALEITHLELESEKLEAPLRLAVVADVQTDRTGEREREVLRAVATEEPDLVLFAGDYFQVPDEERYHEEARALNRILHEVGLAPRLGIHAVLGNVDRDGWETIFDGLGATLYPPARSTLDGGIRITGLALADSFDPTLVVPRSEEFHVVFGHSPDFALGDVAADLLLAGHTHGGQIRLPWFGPPLTLSRVPRAWAAGRTELPSGATLVVSRGVGLERGPAPRMRFNCRPEIVVIDLVPAPPRKP